MLYVLTVIYLFVLFLQITFNIILKDEFYISLIMLDYKKSGLIIINLSF